MNSGVTALMAEPLSKRAQQLSSSILTWAVIFGTTPMSELVWVQEGSLSQCLYYQGFLSKDVLCLNLLFMCFANVFLAMSILHKRVGTSTPKTTSVFIVQLPWQNE